MNGSYAISVELSKNITNLTYGVTNGVMRLYANNGNVSLDGNLFYGNIIAKDGIDSYERAVDLVEGGSYSVYASFGFRFWGLEFREWLETNNANILGGKVKLYRIQGVTLITEFTGVADAIESQDGFVSLTAIDLGVQGHTDISDEVIDGSTTYPVSLGSLHRYGISNFVPFNDESVPIFTNGQIYSFASLASFEDASSVWTIRTDASASSAWVDKYLMLFDEFGSIVDAVKITAVLYGGGNTASLTCGATEIDVIGTGYRCEVSTASFRAFVSEHEVESISTSIADLLSDGSDGNGAWIGLLPNKFNEDNPPRLDDPTVTSVSTSEVLYYKLTLNSDVVAERNVGAPTFAWETDPRVAITKRLNGSFRASGENDFFFSVKIDADVFDSEDTRLSITQALMSMRLQLQSFNYRSFDAKIRVKVVTDTSVGSFFQVKPYGVGGTWIDFEDYINGGSLAPAVLPNGDTIGINTLNKPWTSTNGGYFDWIAFDENLQLNYKVQIVGGTYFEARFYLGSSIETQKPYLTKIEQIRLEAGDLVGEIWNNTSGAGTGSYEDGKTPNSALAQCEYLMRMYDGFTASEIDLTSSALLEPQSLRSGLQVISRSNNRDIINELCQYDGLVIYGKPSGQRGFAYVNQLDSSITNFDGSNIIADSTEVIEADRERVFNMFSVQFGYSYRDGEFSNSVDIKNIQRSSFDLNECTSGVHSDEAVNAEAVWNYLHEGYLAHGIAQFHPTKELTYITNDELKWGTLWQWMFRQGSIHGRPRKMVSLQTPVAAHSVALELMQSVSFYDPLYFGGETVFGLISSVSLDPRTDVYSLTLTIDESIYDVLTTEAGEAITTESGLYIGV